MKKAILLVTILGVVTASCTHKAATDKSAGGNRPSTQRIGQSGSNGTGDGVKSNMLNGTGDGLQNQQWTSYSQQLEEKGLLSSHTARPVDSRATDAPQENKKAPSQAEADVKEMKY